MARPDTPKKTNIQAPPSICFLIPYFGKWPFWFPFFLKSCNHNPSINWLFFSDCGIPEALPTNVRIVEISFFDYCQNVSQALGICFKPDQPYKLCDLKPALGLVHEQELRNFDFWAFGDIDVIYGDLRTYFDSDRLSRRDIFSTHRRRISGHLCILRNNHAMREAFMSVPSWHRLLSEPQHVAFDESAFSRLFVRHKNWPNWLADLASPLHRWTRKTENIEAFSTPNAGVPWIDGSKNFPEAWFWNHGRLTNNLDENRQFPYLHFMAWKQREWRELSLDWTPELAAIAASNQWQISARGITAPKKSALPHDHDD